MRRFAKKMLAAALTAVLAVSVLAGCGTTVKPADYATTVVATMGDEKIYLDEANMYLKSDQYYYEMMYTYMYGSADIWNLPVSNGKETMADTLRANTLTMLRQTYILCSHAEELGISLSEEDMAKVEKAVDQSIGQGDDKLIDAIGVSRERMIGIFAKNALANRVWESVVSAADTNVSDEDARCIGTSYVLVTEAEKKDDDKAEDETEKDTRPAKVRAQEVYDAVKGGSTLKDAAEAHDMKVVDKSYYTKDAFQEGSAGFQAMGMAEGDVKLFQVEDEGWYVMVLNSTMDEKATETKRESIITARQAEVFNAKYAEWQEAAPEFVVNEKVWRSVPFHTIFEAPQTEAPETTAEGTQAETTTGAAEG